MCTAESERSIYKSGVLKEKWRHRPAGSCSHLVTRTYTMTQKELKEGQRRGGEVVFSKLDFQRIEAERGKTEYQSCGGVFPDQR